MKDVQLKIDTWEDKSEWGEGPWQHEADRVAWTDPATGFPCIIRRGTSGSWCGYVGVPEGHPHFGCTYWSDEAPYPEVEVHGGLTFAAPCNEDDKQRGVCHPGPEKRWWFGFDCAHSGDLMPGLEARLREADKRLKEQGKAMPEMSDELKRWKEEYPDQYWTQEQVMMETHYLAQQLGALKISKGGY